MFTETPMNTAALDDTMQNIQYWESQREALGFETVWSMWECADVNQTIFQEKSHRVYYRFIRDNATVEEIYNDEAWVEVSAFTAGGTVLDFWRAAESCYQQAKAQGDWHYFIEDFDANLENGFELTMGS